MRCRIPKNFGQFFHRDSLVHILQQFDYFHCSFCSFRLECTEIDSFLIPPAEVKPPRVICVLDTSSQTHNSTTLMRTEQPCEFHGELAADALVRCARRTSGRKEFAKNYLGRVILRVFKEYLHPCSTSALIQACEFASRNYQGNRNVFTRNGSKTLR